MKNLKTYENWSDEEKELLEEEVPESLLIDEFKKWGLSCDESENYFNQIKYDVNEILVRFTSYAYGGEMPQNLSYLMHKIQMAIGATSWTFWEPMSSVRFFFNESDD